MKKIFKNPPLTLSFIFLIGLFLRLYRLNLNTPALYSDETGQYFIYQALIHGGTSIIQHLINLTFSLTWVLGLTPLGVRLPAAIYGSFLIIALYYFGLTFSNGNKKIGLICSAIVAFIPWDYMISRIGHSHIPLMLLLVITHLVIANRAHKPKEIIISLIPLGLACIYYQSVLIFFSTIFIYSVYQVFKTISKRERGVLFVFLTILILIFGGYISQRMSLFKKTGRGIDLAIWRDVNTTWETDKYRALSWSSEPTLFSFGLQTEQFANKLVYNRAIANISAFSHNYFSFFSLDWLFFKGDGILRHSTGQVGAFYPFLMPFMLFGAFIFFQSTSKKNKTIFLFWIIVSPIPAAITKDGAGYLLRVVTLLPFLTYFCALGIVESFSLFRKNWRPFYGLALGLISLYSAYYFFYGYFHVYPSLSARSFEYGFKELADFQMASNSTSMLVVWDGYYHYKDFLFWQKTPFDQYNSFKFREIVIGETHFNQTFSNLYFVNPKSVQDLTQFIREYRPQFVVLPDRYFVNYPSDLDVIYATPSATINYPDQTPALKIFITKK